MPSVWGQGVAHQEQRSTDDQDQRDDDPDHVDDQQAETNHDEDQADQDHEQATGLCALHGVLERRAECGRVDSAAEHGQAQRVGQLDELVGEEQRQRRGYEGERDTRTDLLDRVPGLDTLVAHHDDAADQDEKSVGGEHQTP